jgi:hypothetical protein
MAAENWAEFHRVIVGLKRDYNAGFLIFIFRFFNIKKSAFRVIRPIVAGPVFFTENTQVSIVLIFDTAK